VSTTLALALTLGAGIGLVLGMLGGGGAVLAVPVLVSVLGEDVHAATTGSLVVVGLAALVGGSRQAGGGYVCWRVAAVLAVAALPGVTIGTVANVHASGSLLVVLLALLILGVAGVTWRRSTSPRVARARGSRLTCPQIPLWKLLGAGLALGVLTGFFGVGGGFLIVPMLNVGFGVPMRLAIGTSLIAIFLMSVAGFANHLAQGSEVDWALVLPFAAATVAGSLAGATLSPRIPRLVLGRMFAVLLTGVAVFMLVSV
jgi:uncharacterized membrane protein YfcA